MFRYRTITLCTLPLICQVMRYVLPRNHCSPPLGEVTVIVGVGVAVGVGVGVAVGVGVGVAVAEGVGVGELLVFPFEFAATTEPAYTNRPSATVKQKALTRNAVTREIV